MQSGHRLGTVRRKRRCESLASDGSLPQKVSHARCLIGCTHIESLRLGQLCDGDAIARLDASLVRHARLLDVGRCHLVLDRLELVDARRRKLASGHLGAEQHIQLAVGPDCMKRKKK